MDTEVILKQIAEHYTFARQHINIICTAFLAFCTLNATFAKISIDFPVEKEKYFFVSTIICFSFGTGNLVAMLVFKGAAVQLNTTFETVASLLAVLPERKKIPVTTTRSNPTLWPNGYRLLLRTVLRGMKRSGPVWADPLNAIPVDDYCAAFGIFACVCFVASLVWFGQFTILCLKAHTS